MTADGLITIIAGSRSITDATVVRQAIENAPFEVARVVSGTAEGVDSLAEEWGKERGLPVDRFPPDYDEYPSRVAPLKRNEEMVDHAEALIAIWNGESAGTEHAIRTAKRAGLRVHIHRTDTSSLADFLDGE